MSTQEEKAKALVDAQKAELKAALEKREEAEKALAKQRDEELVEKYRHFQALAFRMVVGDPQPGETFSFDEKEVRHMAEMLLLLDIARGSNWSRFRSRYAGNY